MRYLTVLVTLIFLTGCCCPTPKSALRGRSKNKKAPVQSLTTAGECTKMCKAPPPKTISTDKTPQETAGTAEVLYQTGTAEDKKRAFNLFLKAAKQGDVHAYVRVGEMYLNGEGVQRDTGKAVEWYRMAAADQIAIAQV